MLQSVQSNSPTPLKVAKAFKDLGFTDLYIADLDAILTATQTPNSKTIAKETELNLLADENVTSIKRA
jgi:uncharacterized protein related to proFAR isomerase